MKLNSKGVFLPKILTITFNFFFSSLTFSTIPLKPLNGPSITLIFSPTKYGTLFSSVPSASSSTLPRILFTSEFRSGVYFSPSVSKKPITLGILVKM
jgi:hypothetical protein